ncbi:hypothetical protein MKQ68_03750 [Chitinophaga horti]|uniref:Lipoprotein n=1 Tax=Chitinophaga horti TaxID=2920382 RepID=A0ABY6J3G0_9BACT|nr:hypothetical protein [Chitinophaga horti]UYQ94205.1 hypothetical protein MKQ68_03750 [Chitinophaga horti]
MKKWLIVTALLQGTFLIACKNNGKEKAQKRRPDSVVMVNTDTMIEATDTNIVAVQSASWAAFEAFDGKYGHDLGLFGQEPLKDRFKALLGENTKAFLERHKVTPPIQVENFLLFSEGCRPHDCTVEESALVIDMKKDIIYAGLAVNKQVKLFSERGDTAYPDRLRKWKTKFAE